MLVHKRLVDQRFKRGTRPSFFSDSLLKLLDDRGDILEIGKVGCSCHHAVAQGLLLLKNLRHWVEELLLDYHSLGPRRTLANCRPVNNHLDILDYLPLRNYRRNHCRRRCSHRCYLRCRTARFLGWLWGRELHQDLMKKSRQCLHRKSWDLRDRTFHPEDLPH